MSPPAGAARAGIRRLKVEEHGTAYKPGRRTSQVRLKGRWLVDAGFPSGTSVLVTVVSPGVIELRLDSPGLFEFLRKERA